MKKWTAICVSAAVLPVLCSFWIGIPGLCADDFVRVYLAERWFLDPQFLQVGEWLPLYNIVYGGSLVFGGDALATAHVLNALFSGGIVWLAALIARELTDDPRVALWAALTILIAPLRILLGFSALSEPLSCFLGLSAVLALLRWQKTGERQWAVALAVGGFLFAATKIEAWPVVLVLGFLVLLTRRDRASLSVAAALWIFPCIWLSLVWMKYGHPFAPFRQYLERAQLNYGGSGSAGPGLALDTLLYFPGVVAVGVLLMREFRSLPRRSTLFFLLAIASAGVQLVLLWKGRPAPGVYPFRTMIFPGLLLSISASVVFSNWMSTGRRTWTAAGMILLGVSTVYGLAAFHPTYDPDLAELGKRIRSSEAFHRKLETTTIGNDVDVLKLATVAAISGTSKYFRVVRVEGNPPKVSLPWPDPPQLFLMESDAAVAVLTKRWPEARVLRFGSVKLITDDAGIVSDLQGRR